MQCHSNCLASFASDIMTNGTTGGAPMGKIVKMESPIDFSNPDLQCKKQCCTSAPSWRCTSDWAIQCWCTACSEWVNCNRSLTGRGEWEDLQEEEMVCPRCGTKDDEVLQPKNLIFMKCQWEIKFRHQEMSRAAKLEGEAPSGGYTTWRADESHGIDKMYKYFVFSIKCYR